MMINATSAQKLEQVERLHAKSDAELAQLGIRRDRIVQAVFGDLF